MLLTLSLLFIFSVATILLLVGRKIPEARVAVAVKNATSPFSSVPTSAMLGAAAAQAGNIFLRGLEKAMRRVKVGALRLDNFATRRISWMREKSKSLSLRYHDWRVQKHGLPKISFDSTMVKGIEDGFDGFYRYFRRGVGYGRATVREDLEAREKVLVGAILADPKNTIAYRELGLYYFEQGNLPDALSAFEAIRKIDPTNSDAADRVTHLREVMGMDEVEVTV